MASQGSDPAGKGGGVPKAVVALSGLMKRQERSLLQGMRMVLHTEASPKQVAGITKRQKR